MLSLIEKTNKTMNMEERPVIEEMANIFRRIPAFEMML